MRKTLFVSAFKNSKSTGPITQYSAEEPAKKNGIGALFWREEALMTLIAFQFENE